MVTANSSTLKLCIKSDATVQKQYKENFRTWFIMLHFMITDYTYVLK